ncbi:uncharacterized protein KD926_006427 [Aspergillus affinis]|uniref:uncharacterized protein n=1 Tax=Aspergillus affinis TaxID=1070780 RepID=UPI0022FEFA71|nr:uncharacterized protein KD926_006427 [Aspergillus affinis]KAI9041881.1 hypothetical protein KD926_006427 [Aspergillus affinis]
MPPLNERYDLAGILPLFTYLHDIDDAIHLARTCRAVYTVFDEYYTRAWIFRCIIRNASHHEQDARLSGIQILRDTFHWGRIPADAYLLRKDFLNGFDFELDAENIFAIVCRWHALRTLFTLYCDKAIHRMYTTGWKTFWDQDSLVKEGCLGDTDPLPRSPSTTAGSQRKIIRISHDQRRRGYRRFYKALISHWCALEHFYLSRVFVYPDDLERNAFNNLASMKWRYNPHRRLSDKLDILEVTDFIWEFLPRKVFDSESPDAWNPDDPTYLVERMYLLRPPQIIQFVDLALRVTPRPLPNRIALFDDLITEYHRFDGLSEGLEAERYCLMDLEDEVAHYIYRSGVRGKELAFVEENSREAVTAWYRYRGQAWWLDSRGWILFRAEGPRMLMTRMLESIDVN